jgi:hypothetical protein
VIRTGRLPTGVEWNPLRTALVTGRRGSTPEIVAPAAGSQAAEVVLHRPHRVEVKTSAQAPAVLVLAENYYPGWRAYLDGRAAPIMRVNYNQRGVRVPAGEHRVSFVYRPRSFYGGLLLTALTGLLLALWARGLFATARGAALLRSARAYLSSRKR